ncbi:MAG: hypothetical protein ACE5HL_12450 [Terriglobia bacterium]
MTKANSTPARPGDAAWKSAIADLRARQRWIRKIARVLGLDPDSPKGVVLRDYLLAALFPLSLSKPRSSHNVLRELQQVLKALPADSPAQAKKAPGRAHRSNLKQHLEQLYGPGVVVVEEVDDGKAPQKTD